MRYATYQARLYCEVEGFSLTLPPVLGGNTVRVPYELPVSSANWTYELNAIPTASCVVAVGNEFRSGAPSPVHALADYLTQRRAAKIWLKLTRVGGDAGAKTFGIPDGVFFTVFDGFTVNGGFSRAAANSGYQLQLEHWTSELAYSSVFSKSSHPANPSQYSFGALSGSSATGVKLWTNLSGADATITINSLHNDFWADGLYKWFEYLCSRDGFQSWTPAFLPGGKNDQSLTALRRMRTSPAAVPLRFRLGADSAVVNAVRDDVAGLTQDAGTLAHTTLWDLLVGTLSGEFLFAVVPRISDALVVPFIPGYRGAGDSEGSYAYKTITADEETSFEWNRAAKRSLRGLGVLSSLKSDTGFNLNPETRPKVSAQGIGGFYPLDAAAVPPTGMIQLVNGPTWVGELAGTCEHAAASIGLAGAAISDAIRPDAAAPSGVAEAAAGRAGTVIKAFLDRYAQARYAQEACRDRQGVATGPLRFDIAPGSTVKVVTPADGVDDTLGLPFYASVVRVSGFINAEGQNSGTGFHLANIRSEGEQTGGAADNVSVNGHPLYADTFGGCGLTDNP